MSADDRRTVSIDVAYVVVIAAAVVVAAVLAPPVWNAVAGMDAEDEERPSVAVITLRGGTNAENVNAVVRELRQARQNDSVEAVVLRIDSPGGPVDSSEEFYLAVNRTAAEMPVVAYVEGIAASGGYYGIAPTDEIVVKPSSTVGSIGVIVQAPLAVIEDAERQRETFVRSGPDKAMISKDSIREDIELLQESFVSTVMRHRGDGLEVSRDEVANGDVYLGPTAVQNGFADRIGDVELAIQRAAALSPAIEGDDYDVAYERRPQGRVSVFIQNDDTVEVDGNIVIVEAEESESPVESEFARVEYYAVWGVPRTNATVAGQDGDPDA